MKHAARMEALNEIDAAGRRGHVSIRLGSTYPSRAGRHACIYASTHRRLPRGGSILYLSGSTTHGTVDPSDSGSTLKAGRIHQGEQGPCGALLLLPRLPPLDPVGHVLLSVLLVVALLAFCLLEGDQVLAP